MKIPVKTSQDPYWSSIIMGATMRVQPAYPVHKPVFTWHYNIKWLEAF